MNWLDAVGLIDLSHPLKMPIPTWHGGLADYTLTTVLDYADCSGATCFRCQHLAMSTGLGTHIDAPAHCIPGGKTVDQISTQQLYAPIAKIDVTAKVSECPSYAITPSDIEAHEKLHGALSAGHHIWFDTGWSARWSAPAAYQNNFLFPVLTPGAARMVIDRRPCSVGIDTLSVDRLGGDSCPVHEIILGAGCFIIENLTNLSRVPSAGAYGLVAPLHIVGGVEAPARVFCLV